MNVQISFDARFGVNQQELPPPYDWLNYCNALAINILEPRCPFCGNYLSNADCQCSQYHAARDKFLAQYNQKNLSVRAYDVAKAELIFLNGCDVKLQLKELKPEDLLKFDNGTETHRLGLRNVPCWNISEGVLENDELTFLIRKKGETEVFECQIKGINTIKKQLPNIQVYYVEERFDATPYVGEHRFGAYRIMHDIKVVEEMPYEVFLQKLTELAN